MSHVEKKSVFLVRGLARESIDNEGLRTQFRGGNFLRSGTPITRVFTCDKKIILPQSVELFAIKYKLNRVAQSQWLRRGIETPKSSLTRLRWTKMEVMAIQ
jgi:hypothetical protein